MPDVELRTPSPPAEGKKKKEKRSNRKTNNRQTAERKKKEKKREREREQQRHNNKRRQIREKSTKQKQESNKQTKTRKKEKTKKERERKLWGGRRTLKRRGYIRECVYVLVRGIASYANDCMSIKNSRCKRYHYNTHTLKAKLRNDTIATFVIRRRSARRKQILVKLVMSAHAHRCLQHTTKELALYYNHHS